MRADLESNAARDRYARLCTVVKSMIGSLKTTQSDDVLAEVSEELVSLPQIYSTPGKFERCSEITVSRCKFSSNHRMSRVL